LKTIPAGGDARPQAGRGQASGTLVVLLSAICYGSMGVFARLAYGSGMDVPSLLLLRFAVATVLLCSMLSSGLCARPKGRSLALLVLMGAVGAGQAFCYFTALAHVSAGFAALLLYTYPALVALLSWLVLKQPPSGSQIACVAMSLAGTVLIIGRAGGSDVLGIGFGLLAALAYAVYIMVGSRLPAEVDPMGATAVITGVSALGYLSLVPVKGFHPPGTGTGALAVVGIAVVCTVLAMVWFFAGLKRVGPVRASVLATVEPLCAVLLGAAALGETITPARALGGMLIAGAVVILAREKARGEICEKA
jgi:drug/metabolite transporter (DMT)-like permease